MIQKLKLGKSQEGTCEFIDKRPADISESWGWDVKVMFTNGPQVFSRHVWYKDVSQTGRGQDNQCFVNVQ